MPKIVQEVKYNGVSERIQRLGLSGLIQEIRQILTGFTLTVLEKRDSNGGPLVRKLLDDRFSSLQGFGD